MSGVLCKLCGGMEYKVEYREGKWQIFKCRECGLLSLQPQPAPSKLDELYDEDYFYNYTMEGTVREYIALREALRPGNVTRLEALARYILPGRLLEVGCAAGFFLEVAREKGWEACGVEISAYASRFAREKLGLEVFTGALEEAALPGESFDAVVMHHVLEHLPDSFATLEEVHRILRPGGIVAVEVPNFGSIDARIDKSIFCQVLDLPRHLYFFTPQTLQMTLEKTGFEVLSCAPSISKKFKGLFGRAYPGSRRVLSPGRRGKAKSLYWLKRLLRQVLPGWLIIAYGRK